MNLILLKDAIYDLRYFNIFKQMNLNWFIWLMIIHTLNICLDIQYQNANLVHIKINVDLCGGTVVKTVLSLQGACVWSLIWLGNWDSPMPHGAAKKKRK